MQPRPSRRAASATSVAAAVVTAWALPDAVTGAPVFGGAPTQRAFEVWLSNWRNYYAHGATDQVPQLKDGDLPEAFRGQRPKVVHSEGGAASGVVTEGVGYALMIEGMMATQGDIWAKDLALGLARSWMGMVQGSDQNMSRPLGGADESDGSATEVNVRPYGVSAIPGRGPAGVATWKFPRPLCIGLSGGSDPCHGSATDGDEDAVMGLVYLSQALSHPPDFVDMVVRSIIAFASADLGFPDLYRTLPDGTRLYVPKAGSQWGGLTPPGGKFIHEAGVPDWCYAPSYFAPANYRTFRDFLKAHWLSAYDTYLPPHLDGKPTTLQDLLDALDAAVLAGYNILYYSSCESGTVSNWVGVAAPCASSDALNCPGVPWEYTPYVGLDAGNCSASGTGWGRYGADASRTPWRVAMDYALFPEESEAVRMFDRSGTESVDIKFNARVYLNRIATQYRRYAKCDGGIPGGCDCHYPGCRENYSQAFYLSAAFEITTSNSVPDAPTVQAPRVTCDNVPFTDQSWWAGFMSWPTFTAFIAPYEDEVLLDNQTLSPMSPETQRTWLEAFANLCDFRNFSAEHNFQIEGAVCQRTYFHASQEVIATMLMSGNVPMLVAASSRPNDGLSEPVPLAVLYQVSPPILRRTTLGLDAGGLAMLCGALLGVVGAASLLIVASVRRRQLLGERPCNDRSEQRLLEFPEQAAEEAAADF